jgi:hypothetical protein
MSNNNLPPVPLVPGSDDDADSAEMEVGDETTLDPDVDADQVNSAEADRLASGAEKHDSLLGGDDPVELP